MNGDQLFAKMTADAAEARALIEKMREALKCEIDCQRKMGQFVFIETDEALTAAEAWLKEHP